MTFSLASVEGAEGRSEISFLTQQRRGFRFHISMWFVIVKRNDFGEVGLCVAIIKT